MPACRDCTFPLFGLPIVFKLLLLLEGRCTSGIRSWEQPALWIKDTTKEPQCSPSSYWQVVALAAGHGSGAVPFSWSKLFTIRSCELSLKIHIQRARKIHD
ncbi:hypothetical protein FN846DRAFT_516653 [Sphaerosporella brunnea]|uniref:Secreted protein n=1 Tax=Sphaerosporella brunnea TaxID=1250544 RepID=A0A5J5F3P0_9PEZI|nr:hypothetical protein FN846DRAFT_516653 [Sphaerosporella brunnea]